MLPHKELYNVVIKQLRTEPEAFFYGLSLSVASDEYIHANYIPESVRHAEMDSHASVVPLFGGRVYHGVAPHLTRLAERRLFCLEPDRIGNIALGYLAVSGAFGRYGVPPVGEYGVTGFNELV